MPHERFDCTQLLRLVRPFVYSSIDTAEKDFCQCCCRQGGTAVRGGVDDVPNTMSGRKSIIKLLQGRSCRGVGPNLDKLNPDLAQREVLGIQSSGGCHDYGLRIIRGHAIC